MKPAERPTLPTSMPKSLPILGFQHFNSRKGHTYHTRDQKHICTLDLCIAHPPQAHPYSASSDLVVCRARSLLEGGEAGREAVTCPQPPDSCWRSTGHHNEWDFVVTMSSYCKFFTFLQEWGRQSKTEGLPWECVGHVNVICPVCLSR